MTSATETPIAKLLNGPMAAGKLTWIGVRSERRGVIVPLQTVDLIAGQGIAGDHYQSRRDGARQVSIIASEDIAAVSGFLNRDIAYHLPRRNLVTAGINVLAIRKRRFRIGSVVLEGSGECAPCSYMEEALGPGGFNAMRGHGGITARIIEGGEIAIGDEVVRLD